MQVSRRELVIGGCVFLIRGGSNHKSHQAEHPADGPQARAEHTL